MSLLEIEGLVSGYGRIPVLHEIDISVDEGELVTVIGANGAGKSTLLRTITGINRAFSGRIDFDGKNITRLPAARINKLGIAQVPENRRVFPAHSVEDNLLLGGWVRRSDRTGIATDLARVYEQFQILSDRRTQTAGALSGGEQQMLVIAMALMARPRLLLLDEPSLGLAPLIVKQVFEEIERLNREGTTILLVEQIANQALKIADRAWVFQLGRVVTFGDANEVRSDPAVRAAYLGEG